MASGDSAIQLVPWSLCNNGRAAAHALGCAGLGRRNCRRHSRLAPATVVGGGMDRLCIVGLVLAPAPGQVSLHRGTRRPFFPRRTHGSSTGPGRCGQFRLDAICRRHRSCGHRPRHQRRPLQEDSPGSVRQRIDVETEQLTTGNENLAVNSGLRINVYQQEPKNDLGRVVSAAPIRLFHYGERLCFPARISLPRNYRNPGAFDYRGYLAENGIVALASTKAASVEVLPGFAGSRAEL